MAQFIRQIIAERASQDAKWGQQNHDNRKWVAILMEEVGEVARAVLEAEQGQQNEDPVNLREELVQVAAVALNWLECLERNKPSPTPEAKPVPRREAVYPKLSPGGWVLRREAEDYTRRQQPIITFEPPIISTLPPPEPIPSRRDVPTLMMNREAA